MNLPQRKPNRIPDYDYSTPGAYFITICTHNRNCLFGTVENLNGFGQIAAEVLLEIPKHFPHSSVDKFIVMPNHIHLLVHIDREEICGAAGTSRTPSPTGLTYHAGPHVFYSTVDQQNVRQFGPRPCRVHKKFSILFVQSVLYCYQRAPGWADPGRKKEKYASILRAERPSTRRFRVNGDGTGRLEFVRHFWHAHLFSKGVYE